MEPCLREVLAPDLRSRLSESSDSSFEGYKKNKEGKDPDYFKIISVNYRFDHHPSRENKKVCGLSDIEDEENRNRGKKNINRSFFRCTVYFSLLFIIASIMYSRTEEKSLWKRRFKVGLKMAWEIKGLRFAKYAKAEEYNEKVWKGSSEKGEVYEIEKEETKDQLVRSNLAIVDKIDPQLKLEEVSLLVLDTEGLAYRTDFTKKLIWATRLTEDLLRVQKPISSTQEMCALEDIAKYNINKDKTIGHQIFSTKNVKEKIKKGTKSNKEEEKYNQDYKYERLKSHLVPSYDGYVYYVDDFNTKLLKVHVKDIVNYTPFYTPLLEGVYLEGSRNSLVIALDYETGTYITRHNREEDTKNHYALNYIVQEGKNQQLHVAITNWSVKAYTEKGHKQIWDFDWLEVGSVMSQSNNEVLVDRIKNAISVKSNRLFFNNIPKNEGINNLAFPFPISSVFAIFKTQRNGIYTLEMLERIHIPPPPNFLYNSSINSTLSSSRKIAHKSLYVENGVIGVLDDSKLVTLVDDKTIVDTSRIVNKKLKKIGQSKRLLLEDKKNKNEENAVKGSKIGIGVDEKGIIMIGSSVVKRETRMTKKERTTEFLFRWWWLLISWVMVMIATPFYWAATKLKKSRKKVQKEKAMTNTTENSLESRTEIYDSKTEVYDSSDGTNEETKVEYRRKRYKKAQEEEEMSDMSIERKMSIDEINKKEMSNEIRRAKSEGNFEEVIENDYTESVWMEEQSLINVLTNNQFQVKRKKYKLPKMLTIQYENKINKVKPQKEEINANMSTTVSNEKKEEESKKEEKVKEKEKEQKEDKEKDEPKLSLIPKGSVLSKFLENGRFLRTFECIKMLGKGGFGSVYRARHKLEPGNPVYAIKFVLLKLKATEDLSSRRYFREVAANRDIYSKYVVRYYTWWCEEPHFLPLAQMSSQLQMAAINNIRYLIQNKIIPEELINPENQSKGEEITNTEKNNMLNKYIKEYREIIYEYIQNPKQDDLFPNFSQIAQKTKQNNVKGTVSFNPNKEDSNPYMFSENSNIQFKESSGANKNDEVEEVVKENNVKGKVKEKLPIINEYESNKFNENKQYQVVLLILMEMCKGLTLREWLNRSERSNRENDNKKIEFLLFKQIIKGLRDIHKNCFIHRDLKPENIFVDEKNNLKIGDLGLVGFIQENHPNSYQPVNTVKQHLLSDATQVSVRGQVIGTPGYTAPEGGGNCTEKVDIYSAALILLELLCPRFTTVMERLETLEKFRKNHEAPDFIKEKYKPWYELMVQMADSNPENRPSADQVYRHLKLILNSQ